MPTTWGNAGWGGVCSALVLWATAAAAQPDPATHWLSLINTTHANPRNMIVVVVPPAFFSAEAMTAGSDWIGPDALYGHPGTQAALEAIDYWDWMLHDGQYRVAKLENLSWTTKVLGVDATESDLAAASIIVNTGMMSDPLPFVFHFGVGAPTLPPWALVSDLGSESQELCTVWNTGIGSEAGDREPARLRNLVLHEFGHCISAGHTGTSLDMDHVSRDGTVYESHPTDVMSDVFGDRRQCLSNLNVQSIAEGYAFLPGAWKPHDGETFMLKTAYRTACMPSHLANF